MIELISPKMIKNEIQLGKEFKSFGIDFHDINSGLGWNYALDHIWLYNKISSYIQEKQLKKPSILDVGCGNSPFHNFVEKKLNINITGIDRPQGFCHQEIVTNADYFCEFQDFKELEKNSVDIIYWLSAIEHNKISTIKNLYKKSIYFLKPGGLLLITFPISKKTYWFKDSQQTNLSLKRASKIFKEEKIIGDFDDIHDEFRKDYLLLKEKYFKRYGHFDVNDPEFIVGGLEQIK